MPSFSESLEKTLHNALKAASERHHEYATLEHLLYALIDDEHAAEVMRACGVALDDLQSAPIAALPWSSVAPIWAAPGTCSAIPASGRTATCIRWGSCLNPGSMKNRSPTVRRSWNI